MVRQLLFEAVDLRIGSMPFVAPGKTLDAFHQHAPVPGSVEQGGPAVPGDLAPESPQVMLGALLIGGRRKLHEPVQTWVDGLGNAADTAALAGRVPAFKHRNAGDFFPTRFPGQVL